MTPCVQPSPTADLALPVLKPPAVKHSKAGRRRAAVLIGVHLLIAIHVAHWLAGGRTLSPLEPSESMEFSKQSIVNAGLIFFALTILSTLVLGRWFCGWACHLVALQDLCRWILGKLKLRPKPARLGLLATVPLAAFAYMFLAPPVHRLLMGAAAPPATLHLTTDSFWATFPSWLPTVLTLFTCGFAAVYFLGSKGFCTYGCPYGAIFGVADRFAPGRIRVTDACEGCGHCTSVCSSNVRVHEEVRDFGMVVDPGCMKCLDCVSVCPNDALYFGFGAPALGAKPRTPPQRSPRRDARRRALRAAKRPAAASAPGPGAAMANWALTGGFLLACYGLFMWHDGDPQWQVASVLTVGSLAVLAMVGRGGARRVVEYSLLEQALLGALFLGAVMAFRGLYGLVPFLFSLGLAAVLACLGVTALRLLYRRNEALHRWRLKRGGRLQPAGAVFASLMLGTTAVAVHGGMVQFEARRGAVAARYVGLGNAAAELGRLDEAREAFTAALRLDDELPIAWFNLGVVEGRTAGRDAAAIVAYERAVYLEPEFIDARENLAGMYCKVGRFREGIAQFERALRDRPDDPRTHELLARAHLAVAQRPQAEAHARRALVLDPHCTAAPAVLAELELQRGPEDARAIEQEVRDHVLDQVVGDGRVRHLALPEPLLRRVIDRVIRDSYRQREWRRFALPDGRRSDDGPAPGPGEPRSVVISAPLSKEVQRSRAWILEGRPPLPGFRAPILDAAGTWQPFEPPPAPPEGDAVARAAARLVIERLARDGLGATTAEAVQLLGAARLAEQPDGGRALLASIGLPVDLLEHFELTGGPASASAGAEFKFRPTRPGFAVATEEGSGDIALLRLQLPRGDDERGPGDGGSLDLARQVIEALPGAAVIASIPLDQPVPALPGEPTLVAEALPISQWAQDNGKPGWIDGLMATIVPRYASRHEDGSVFVPGDSFLADGLEAAGLDVFQSPLLFQGGSVVAVRDPASGARILLLGEAEVARNIALGLTEQQVIEAFTSEFGVDRCVVLPAVSFHLDWDVSVRAVDGGLVAFVNDTGAAARITVDAGVEALAAAGAIGADDAAAARADLAAHRDEAFLARVRPVILALPGAAAAHFARTEADPPAANMRRFLAALDILAATTLRSGELSSERHGEAYYRSLRRRQGDERDLQERLREEGFRVVAIPSLADDDSSMNTINGIQAPDRYLMPAWGGPYEALDRAAAAAFAAELGPSAQVVPIRSALSQERVGAVHCSASACSRP